MAASNVLMLKKAGDKRQEQALQEAFKVSIKYLKVLKKYPKQVSKIYPRSKQYISQAGKQKIS